MKKIAYLLVLMIIIGCSANKSKRIASANINSYSEIDFTNEYIINDEEFGTKTSVTIVNGLRKMTTNALPNHTTGEFPNQGNPNTIKPQNITYSIPLQPKFTGKAIWAREPGVAVNGIKFEPETAERFICETGEHYKIEAFQNLVDLGLDFNNAHVQPTGAYHYHGAPTQLIEKLDNGEDLILIGYAHDGFAMYYSKSGAYKPSYKLSGQSRTGEVCKYNNPHMHIKKDFRDTKTDGTFVSDWEYIEGLGDLDECNGTQINGKYAYVVTDTYPYVSRCLKGEFEESMPQGPPPGIRHDHSHGNGKPNHKH